MWNKGLSPPEKGKVCRCVLNLTGHEEQSHGRPSVPLVIETTTRLVGCRCGYEIAQFLSLSFAPRL